MLSECHSQLEPRGPVGHIYIYINVIRSATVSLNPEALLDTNINIRSATVGLKTEALLDTYRAYQAA